MSMDVHCRRPFVTRSSSSLIKVSGHVTSPGSSVSLTAALVKYLAGAPSRFTFACSYFNYPPFASRAKEEVFGLLYVCLFVCLFVCSSTISRQPAGRFMPKFACRRTLVPDVSSPLLGVGGPRRVEKGANEIFVTMGVNGEFLHFGGF